MPIPIAPAIAAGGSLLSTALGGFFTGHQNRRSQQFSRDMYDRQYSDNLKFWRMQNEYNSPQSQMERLKAGGLNPNLVYGGSTGQASGQADKISTPDVQAAQFRTPDFSGVGNAGINYLNAMYDFDIKQAQIDNLKADNTVKLAEAALKVATTSRSEFDLGFETDLKEISANIRKEQLRQMKAQTEFTLSDNERKTAMNSANLKAAAEGVLRMKMQNAKDKQEIERIKAAIRSINSDVKLKQLDIDLWKQGISRSDPLWMRVLSRAVQEAMKGKINSFFKY